MISASPDVRTSTSRSSASTRSARAHSAIRSSTIQRLAHQRNALRLGAGQQEHGVDEPRQPRGLLRDDRERLPVVVFGPRRPSRERDLGGRANDGDRRAQLVGRIGHELPLRVQRRARRSSRALKARANRPSSSSVFGACRRAEGSRSVIAVACGAMSVNGRSVCRPTIQPPTPATASATSTPTAERRQEFAMLGLHALERAP